MSLRVSPDPLSRLVSAEEAKAAVKEPSPAPEKKEEAKDSCIAFRVEGLGFKV